MFNEYLQLHSLDILADCEQWGRRYQTVLLQTSSIKEKNPQAEFAVSVLEDALNTWLSSISQMMTPDKIHDENVIVGLEGPSTSR